MPCQAAFAWSGRAPHALGAPLPRGSVPISHAGSLLSRIKAAGKFHCRGHGDSGAGGEVVEGNAGDVEQDSLMNASPSSRLTLSAALDMP